MKTQTPRNTPQTPDTQTQTPNKTETSPYRDVTSPSTTNTRQKQQEQKGQQKTHPAEDVEDSKKTHTEWAQTGQTEEVPVQLRLYCRLASREERERICLRESCGGRMSSGGEWRGERGRPTTKRSSSVRRSARPYT